MTNKINSPFSILHFPFRRRRGGFTLIELLVVITIIGVLTSIGILSYQSTNRKARDGRRKSELEQIRTALEIYRSDYNLYPTTLALLVPDYTASLPIDPKDPTYTYYYLPAANFRSYDLCAYFELGSSSACGIGGASCGDEECSYGVTNP